MPADVYEAALYVGANESPAYAPQCAPAEQNAAHSHAGRGYIGIEVVREVGGRTSANLYGHIVAELAAHDALNVAFFPGKVAPVVITVVAAVLELRGVVANVELRQAARFFALYLTLTAIRPAPNMAEGVFYSSVRRNFERIGYARAVVYALFDNAGSVAERIGCATRYDGIIAVIGVPIRGSHSSNARAESALLIAVCVRLCVIIGLAVKVGVLNDKKPIGRQLCGV